ncbi:MAG: biotin/lipoyl-binding protein [Bacteroidaceae bacterium]|jgi:biotin carboxyl carrier protein|nr:biotin/lipoyl-binding protein [Bacteroidaceae bacterium]
MKEFKFKIGGTDYLATVEELQGGNMQVTVNGQTYQVEMPQTRACGPRPAMAGAAPVAQAGGPKNVVSELPGTVTEVKVGAGQHVKRGEVLLVIEAMKMANDIVAEVDGTVQRVAVSNGQSVNQGDLLVEMVADVVAAPVAAPAPKAAPASAPAAAPVAPVAAAPAAGAKSVTAPLPGSITKISVKVGDTVAAGDTVLMMEAMKMENSITAEFAGTVKAILCKEGDQVQSGQALVELS